MMLSHQFKMDFFWSLIRVLAGISIVFLACLYQVYDAGVSLELFNNPMILSLPFLGALCGVWLGLSDPFRLKAIGSIVRRQIIRNLDRAAYGALFFGSFGIFALTVKIFLTLSDSRAALSDLMNVAGAMFFGLFIGSVLKAISFKWVLNTEGKVGEERENLWDTEARWYLCLCASISLSILIIFAILK